MLSTKKEKLLCLALQLRSLAACGYRLVAVAILKTEYGTKYIIFNEEKEIKP